MAKYKVVQKYIGRRTFIVEAKSAKLAEELEGDILQETEEDLDAHETEKVELLSGDEDEE